ncbi:MAG TPA: thiamine pyrophosphate-requiring protein [Puia sp.]|jgi:pyruvate dehydrogenase (quinone)|nr:thiamine pyrophosphate-requiring protein [Puia sp.]
MAQQVSDFIVERLISWGVKRIYGYPGDGINGVMGALNRAKERIDFIQTRHEEAAAFMACAHAKFTGEVGVCMSTSGPGAIHLLNGLYDAKMDHQPVVALVGQQARMSMGGDYQQEVDLQSLFKDVAHEYVHTATDPSQVRHLIDRAIRIARVNRTVTCVILPNDIQELDYAEPPHLHGSVHTGMGYTKPEIVPGMADLQAAADILNSGTKVAILVGAGAAGAADEIIEAADALGAGVAKALLGKAVLPDDLPFVTGSIGLLGTKPSYDLMMECDTLLMIGTSFPYSEFLPKEGKVKAVQIDIDGRMLGLRYPTDVNLQGDSRKTLQALLPLLAKKTDLTWQQKIQGEIDRWWKVLEARAMKSANPINPQRFFWELSSLLPDRCILTADSGSIATWFAMDLKIRKGMMASLSGNLATMCPGVPYAIAAKFAYPDRMPIALVGDGAMQMMGINELITIAKYYKRWPDPRLMIVVLNNRDLNMVTWEQRVMVGDPKFEASQDVPEMNYAEYARMLGLEGIRVEKEDEIGPGLRQAMAAQRPVVLDLLSDPSVPPLPPHITLKQAKHFTSSILKGDVNAWDMIKETYREVVENFLPHRS